MATASILYGIQYGLPTMDPTVSKMKHLDQDAPMDVKL